MKILLILFFIVLISYLLMLFCSILMIGTNIYEESKEYKN